MTMRILIGYDGSESADAALDDLRRAGLPREVEALVVSVGEVSKPPSSVANVVAGPLLTSRRLSVVLAQVEAQGAQKLKEVKKLAAKAGDRLRCSFPD